ncbi:hydroxymethylbilane synthase [Leifsonia sp. F6_8S_P_1B]|uniref:Porphobilinogen deaminase n=1 Tax=Leifsonia williamsii TaxID=3035919 RepID=A0ABT8K9C7_9MICO|nr:hydroxymethylbilane synthase [Leifsonia williamsii]MDN4613642.1 hydroxymethylbilane synthase [Leifsonia williamsii]
MSGTVTRAAGPVERREGVLRVGTRGSALAVAQTTAVAEAIARATGVDVELVTVTTHGDTSRESLSELGGTGVFATALRDALRVDEVDIIVHSLKDLPTAKAPGLVIGAVPKRADARDTLCARDGLTLDALPDGARVGTGSPRRVAQLKSLRPDLDIVDIRGNVDTRLGRVAEGDLDAVVLAAAGLGRLGRLDAVTDYFPLSQVPTAPGQGALALEVREGDEKGRGPIARALSTVDHVTTHACITAEREVLAGLEAGCAAPIAASALVDDGLLFLTASVYRPDGSERLTASHAATPDSLAAHHLDEAARDVGARVVSELLGAGAADLAPLGSTR